MQKLTRIFLLAILVAGTLGASGCNSTVYMGVGVAGPWYGHPGAYPYPHPYPIGGGGIVVIN